MHKTLLKQGNSALIAGILVVLIVAGLFKLLWLSINAPFFWIALLAWLVLPLLPFAIRLVTLCLSSQNREVDGVC